MYSVYSVQCYDSLFVLVVLRSGLTLTTIVINEYWFYWILIDWLIDCLCVFIDAADTCTAADNDAERLTDHTTYDNDMTRDSVMTRDTDMSRDSPTDSDVVTLSTHNAAPCQHDASDSPVSDSPVHDSPIRDSPIHDSPIHDSPIHDSPVHDSPAHDSDSAVQRHFDDVRRDSDSSSHGDSSHGNVGFQDDVAKDIVGCQGDMSAQDESEMHLVTSEELKRDSDSSSQGDLDKFQGDSECQGQLKQQPGHYSDHSSDSERELVTSQPVPVTSVTSRHVEETQSTEDDGTVVTRRVMTQEVQQSTLYTTKYRGCIVFCCTYFYQKLLFYSFYRAKRSGARYYHGKLSVCLSVRL